MSNLSNAVFRASYHRMVAGYTALPVLTPETRDLVVYAVMCDKDGHLIDVPCTLLAAYIIRRYQSGTPLILWISPTVLSGPDYDNPELVPLCVGAVPEED